MHALCMFVCGYCVHSINPLEHAISIHTFYTRNQTYTHIESGVITHCVFCVRIACTYVSALLLVSHAWALAALSMFGRSSTTTATTNRQTASEKWLKRTALRRTKRANRLVQTGCKLSTQRSQKRASWISCSHKVHTHTHTHRDTHVYAINMYGHSSTREFRKCECVKRALCVCFALLTWRSQKPAERVYVFVIEFVLRIRYSQLPHNRIEYMNHESNTSSLCSSHGDCKHLFIQVIISSSSNKTILAPTYFLYDANRCRAELSTATQLM